MSMIANLHARAAGLIPAFVIEHPQGEEPINDLANEASRIKSSELTSQQRKLLDEIFEHLAGARQWLENNPVRSADPQYQEILIPPGEEQGSRTQQIDICNRICDATAQVLTVLSNFFSSVFDCCKPRQQPVKLTVESTAFQLWDHVEKKSVDNFNPQAGREGQIEFLVSEKCEATYLKEIQKLDRKAKHEMIGAIIRKGDVVRIFLLDGRDSNANGYYVYDPTAAKFTRAKHMRGVADVLTEEIPMDETVRFEPFLVRKER